MRPTKLGPIPMPEPPAAYVKVIVAKSWQRALHAARALGFPPRGHRPPPGVVFVTSPVDLRSIRAAEYRESDIWWDNGWEAERSLDEFHLISDGVRSRIRLPRKVPS